MYPGLRRRRHKALSPCLVPIFLKRAFENLREIEISISIKFLKIKINQDFKDISLLYQASLRHILTLSLALMATLGKIFEKCWVNL